MQGFLAVPQKVTLGKEERRNEPVCHTQPRGMRWGTPTSPLPLRRGSVPAPPRREKGPGADFISSPLPQPKATQLPLFLSPKTSHASPSSRSPTLRVRPQTGSPSLLPLSASPPSAAPLGDAEGQQTPHSPAHPGPHRHFAGSAGKLRRARPRVPPGRHQHGPSIAFLPP